MKMPLFRVKERKNNSHENERYNWESKGVQKRQLGKLTKIEVQLQPK